jgi:DNA-binding transcriptional regulator YhcF (GntR family)
MSEQIISELVERLRALGLSDEQIPESVRAWIERDHSGTT